MKLYAVTILFICLAYLDVQANQFSNIPYLINGDTYWLALDDEQGEKGRSWGFTNPAPPPLLPNEVISIVTNTFHKQKLAGKQWEIIGVTLRQTGGKVIQKESSTTISKYVYSYYLVELSELLVKGTPEYKKRMKEGHTRLARIEMAVTMDGKAILPKKGKHMSEVSPELWELYKRKHNIEQTN